jgi:hypothetical protein
MLNIPLFLIRQYQFTNRCSRLKAVENHTYYKLVFINQLQYANNEHLKSYRVRIEKYPCIKFLSLTFKYLNNYQIIAGLLIIH